MKRKGFTLVELLVTVIIIAVVVIVVGQIIGGCTGLGGKWCDGCRGYFWQGEVATIKVPNGRDLHLCSKHYTRFVMYQQATRGGNQLALPPDFFDGK